MKFYIRSASAVSPQHSLDRELFCRRREESEGNRRNAIEPDYSAYVDGRMIRRMSRIIKMGVAAAVDCLRQAGVQMPQAIVTGTAYGCLEDTGIFLRRMIANGEELLPPTAFIQSTHNTVGAQIALLLKCHGYNNTIVHSAFSFENALTDAGLLLREGMEDILAGAADEITVDSHTILSRFGLYKKEDAAAATDPKSGQAGEGAAFFLLSNHSSPGTLAELKGLETLYKPVSSEEVEQRMHRFLGKAAVAPEAIDLILTGYNEDVLSNKTDHPVFKDKTIFPFKALCGEYPTASGFALWLACMLVSRQAIPDWLPSVPRPLKNILIHNHYLNSHHAFYLVSAC